MSTETAYYESIFLNKKKYITYNTSFYDSLLKTENIDSINEFLLSANNIRIFNNFTKEECAYILKKGVTTNIKNTRGQNIWFGIKNAGIAKVVYGYNSDINMPDEKGNVPVKSACAEMLNFFISKGVSLDYINENGCNLLWFSKEKETQILLKNGVNINHRNNMGETCLFIKSCMSVNEMREHYYLSKPKAKILIKNNIDINSKNINNKNALVGLEGLHSDIIKILIENGIDYEGYVIPPELRDFISNREKEKLTDSIFIKNNRKPDMKRL